MARTPATRWTTDTDVHADAVNLMMDEIEAEIADVEAAIPAIVNDVTTGEADKALSAEMGKQLKTEVGDLTTLSTTVKDSLVNAVNEVFSYGSSFKSDVAAAITAKGVVTQATDTKETFVANISAIETGGGTAPKPLIFEIETTAANTAFEFPAYAPYELEIDWGDGTAKDTASAKGDSKVSMNHVYAAPGRYVVTVSGWCAGFRFSNANVTSRNIVKKATQIGDVPMSLFESFRGCTNLTDISNLAIDNKYIRDASYMFRECTKLATIPSNLIANTNITNVSYMFFGCTGLTAIPAILIANTSITNVSYMFYGCSGINIAVPEWWNINDRTFVSTTKCFYNCTNATNYAAIPAAWK